MCLEAFSFGWEATLHIGYASSPRRTMSKMPHFNKKGSLTDGQLEKLRSSQDGDITGQKTELSKPKNREIAFLFFYVISTSSRTSLAETSGETPFIIPEKLTRIRAAALNSAADISPFACTFERLVLLAFCFIL